VRQPRQQGLNRKLSPQLRGHVSRDLNGPPGTDVPTGEDLVAMPDGAPLGRHDREIDAWPAIDPVAAVTERDHGVDARARVQAIVARAVKQRVRAAATEESVVALSALEQRCGLVREDRAAAGRDEPVVASSAIEPEPR
jgi:hypothetical protein